LEPLATLTRRRSKTPPGRPAQARAELVTEPAATGSRQDDRAEGCALGPGTTKRRPKGPALRPVA